MSMKKLVWKYEQVELYKRISHGKAVICSSERGILRQ